METGTASAAALAQQLEGELRMVHEAILMVASSAATRVTVGGLRLSTEILGRAQQMAEDAGVRLIPLWSGDEQRLDFCVEAPR
jgi:hypothetical protein